MLRNCCILIIATWALSAYASTSPLRQVCSNTSATGQNAELGAALKELNSPAFSTPQKRKMNEDSFFTAIKNVLKATTTGAHLIDCLDNDDDSRFASAAAFSVKDDLDKLTASFEYLKDPKTGKYVRNIKVLSSESPMAAITFVAHEMQHSCNAGRMLSADLNKESDLVYDQLLLVDEMRAYKLQAEFFLELARQAPALVCESSPQPSALYMDLPLTLQEMLARADEGIKDGTFYSNVVGAYVRIGVYPTNDHFYDEHEIKISDEESNFVKKPRTDLVERFEAADFKIVPP